MVTIIGIKLYRVYENPQYFSAEISEIPLRPSNDIMARDTRVTDSWENGTLICEVNDSVELLWTIRENHTCFLCCCNLRESWWL